MVGLGSGFEARKHLFRVRTLVMTDMLGADEMIARKWHQGAAEP